MQPLSPLDGRYAKKVDALRPFFTEEALMRARVFVEISYFAALAEEKGIPELKSLSAKEKKAMQALVDEFNDKEAEKIREIEKKTNHDVKAVEYYLQKELQKIVGAKFKNEFLHFALTSEDVNNLAYGVLISDALRKVVLPELRAVITAIRSIAGQNMKRRMLSLTHGQPATPTTLGKEMMVFDTEKPKRKD
jgi:adenylosuccinate lyase